MIIFPAQAPQFNKQAILQISIKTVNLCVLLLAILRDCQCLSLQERQIGTSETRTQDPRQLLFDKESQSQCFRAQPIYTEPQVLGGNNGDTIFSCLDYSETSGRILLGGSSTSYSDLVNQPQTPILTLIDDQTGAALWIKQVISNFTIVPAQFTYCSISEIQKQVVALSESPQYSMNIFDLETGSLVKSFFEQDSLQPSAIYAQRSVVGVTINSSNRLFSVSTQGNQLYVSSFNLDLTAATLIPIYYKSYGSSTSPFFARSFGLGPDPSFAYVFGSINSRLSLQKLSVSDGSTPFTYTVGTPLSGGASKAIAIGKVQQFLALYTIVGCAEGLGASQNDIGMLQYQETLLGIVVLLKTFYLTMNQKTYCRDFQFDTVNLYFTFYVANTAMYFGKADITQILTSLQAKELKLTSASSQGFNMASSYVQKGGSKFYYAGSTKSINSQAYAKSTAFINSYPDNGGLIAPETTKVFPLDIQTTFISVFSVLKFMLPAAGAASSSNLNMQMRSTALVSAIDLKNSSIVQLPESMMRLPAQGVIYPPQIQGLYVIQVYESSNEEESITLGPFSYSLNCSDIKWEYSAQLTNGSALPNFIKLETNSAGSISLKIIKSDDSTGNFQIALTALLSGMYSKSITLPILIQKVSTTTTSTTTSSVTSTTTPAPTTTTSPIISSTSSSPITSQSTQTETQTSTLTTAPQSTALTGSTPSATPQSQETSQSNPHTTLPDPTPTPTPQSSTTSSLSTQQQSTSTTSAQIDQESTPIPYQTPTPTNQPSNTLSQGSTSTEDSIISSSVTTQSPTPAEDPTQTEAPSESDISATTPVPISSQMLVSTVTPSENIQPVNTTSVAIPITTIEASSSSTIATSPTPAPSTTQPSQATPFSSTQPIDDSTSSSTQSTQTLAPSTSSALVSQDLTPTPTPTISQAETNMPSTTLSQTPSATPSIQVTSASPPSEQVIITQTPLPHTTIFQTQTQSSTSTPSPSFSLIVPSLSLTPQSNTTQAHLPLEQVIEVQAFPDYLELGTQKMVSIQITNASSQIENFSVLYPHRFVSFISAADKAIVINPKSSDKGTYLFSYELKEKVFTKQVSMIKIKATEKNNQGVKSNQSNSSSNSSSGAFQNQTQLWLKNLIDTLEISSINDNQEATFTYTSSIKGNLTIEIIEQILSLNLTSQKNAPSNNSIKSWKVIKFDESTFTIHLEFEDSSSISLFQNQDYLRALFNTTTIQRVIQKRIPAQFQSDQERFASTTLSLNLQYFLEVAVYGNFLLATFMGSSLQFIWTMINHLQLISHTPLFRIPYTANILCLLHTQFSVVNFDTFQGSEALQKMFTLKEQEEYPPLDEYFELSCFGTTLLPSSNFQALKIVVVDQVPS